MIKDIIRILENYLNDNLIRCHIVITPNSFSIKDKISLNATIPHQRVEKSIRKILGYKKYFEYCPTKGVIIWEISKGLKNILEFENTPKENDKLLEIKKLDIYLNFSHGILKHAESNHDRVKSDGYIGNTRQIMNLRLDYRFLYSDYVQFISLENDTIFYYKEDLYKNNDNLSFVIIPNNLINI